MSKIYTDELILGRRGSLERLHNIYKKYLYIEDTKRIDVVLATALSSKYLEANSDHVPIWLILVGPSGDMKSVQLNAIEGFGTHYLHKITSRTLVNGQKDKLRFPDLAPKLNNKLVVIRDMASLLKLPPQEKGEVWGQLRDLYDGFAGTASGMGVDCKYDNLNVTLLAGSTPAIDSQILVHQDLGTRELIYRTNGSNNKEKVMQKCIENEECIENISQVLREETLSFLNGLNISRDIIKENDLKKIKEIALYTAYMRASAELDQYTNEVRNDVYPEEPTRIIKQMKRLYLCLLGLAEDYPQDRAIEILWNVAKSSAFPVRVRLLDALIKQDDEITSSGLSKILQMGKSTTMRELSVLWNMGVVERRDEPTKIPEKFVYYWKINEDHPLIKTLLKEKASFSL